MLQYSYSVLRTSDHNWKFYNSLEGQISKCLFDKAYNTPSSHCVDKLKLKLFFQYNAVYNDEVQRDYFQCLLFMIDIKNNEFVPCSADEHLATFYRDSLSEFLFSFVLENILSVIYAN